jgi:3,4-dehydroadipyl-CoA semialdehyde dehydrogenase
MKLESYVEGRWQTGTEAGRPLVNPVTGETIATADAHGVDMHGALEYARLKGGPALHALTFAERGGLLSAVADILLANRERYVVIARENSGNTDADASVDIDGAIFTLKMYARYGKSLGDATSIIEPDQDQLARDPVFFVRHCWTTRPGVGVQINAFNFPAWGMWEKMAQATLAGVPSLAKPATSTAMLSERMVRDVIGGGVLPEGAMSLICGGAEGLFTALHCMDSLAFTGSATTGKVLRTQLAEFDAAPRLTIEADSVNASILGPDVGPGTDLFNLAVSEVVKALSVKAGQLCTNIRRIFVPTAFAKAFADELAEKVEALVVGDPAEEGTRVGPLINITQRDEAKTNIGILMEEARIVAQADMPEMAPDSGFVAPVLLFCDTPEAAVALHATEVFGPCATVLPYDDIGDAVRMGTRAEGSLALSLFSDDSSVHSAVTSGLAPWHGRILIIDSTVGKAHTGHAIVMPQCVHGGPGRAGNGEELGGLRGLRFHMQRLALQGSSDVIGYLAERAVERTL